MGLLKAFRKSAPKLLQLPSGSFTVDRNGSVLVRTLPSGFPQDIVEEIGNMIIAAFKDAQKARVPLNQIEVSYPNLKITARELRGGAMIFLSPKTT